MRNQCATPTRVHWSIRVCPSVSRTIVAVRAPGRSVRPGRGLTPPHHRDHPADRPREERHGHDRDGQRDTEERPTVGLHHRCRVLDDAGQLGSADPARVAAVREVQLDQQPRPPGRRPAPAGTRSARRRAGWGSPDVRRPPRRRSRPRRSRRSPAGRRRPATAPPAPRRSASGSSGRQPPRRQDRRRRRPRRAAPAASPAPAAQRIRSASSPGVGQLPPRQPGGHRGQSGSQGDDGAATAPAPGAGVAAATRSR